MTVGTEQVVSLISVATRVALSALNRSSYVAGTLAYVVENGQYYGLTNAALTVDGTSVLAASPSGSWAQTLPGAPALNDLTGIGAQSSGTQTASILGLGSGADTRGSTGRAVTTDGTTWVNIFTFAPPANSGDDWSVSVMGLDVTGAPPISGAFYRADLQFSTIRVGSAAPTLAPTTPAPANVPSGVAAYSTQVVITGNVVQVQVRGLAAKTVNWSGVCQRMAVS